MNTTVGALWSLFGRRRGRWVLLSALVALTSAMEALAAAAVFALVGLISAGSIDLPVLGRSSVDDGDLLPFAAVTIAVFVLRGVVVVLHNWLLYRLCYGAGAEVETSLLRGYLTLPPRRIRSRGQAQLVRNVHDTVMTVVEESLIPVVLAIGTVLQTVAILVVMLLAAPWPTLGAALLFTPVLWIIARGLRGPARRLGEQAEEALADSLRVATETLHLSSDIRAAGRSEDFAERFGAVRRELARAGGAEEVLRGLPRLVAETALVLFVLVYVAVGTARGDADAVLPTIGLFAYAALRLLPSVLGVVGTAHSLASSGPAREALVADAPLIRAGRVVAQPSSAPRTLELSGAVLRRPGGGTPVLDGADLVLRRGEVVAVVGANGAGKSTLLDVLAGLLPLDAGTVRADGVPLDELESSWPAQVATVPQHVHLLDADIPVNITLDPSGRSSDDPSVARVVREVELDAVVRRLAGAGVGEDGRELSGGERQRIAVARALYRSAGVLLVDEGTSALDPAAREGFMRMIGRGREDRITVLVTHDPDLARSCDRIVRVEGGTVHDGVTPVPVPVL